MFKRKLQLYACNKSWLLTNDFLDKISFLNHKIVILLEAWSYLCNSYFCPPKYYIQKYLHRNLINSF
uniref:Uncharacterized protein n=1 Tax=Anguilla anguilla TaxID=7936 RepID=A0A0E9WWQ3_ANGAN